MNFHKQIGMDNMDPLLSPSGSIIIIIIIINQGNHSSIKR